MPKANEMEIIRVYDAPVKLVWDAYTDLEHASKWWGPRGFTITTKSKDFREGGKWIYTMHGPDGIDYPNIATYHTIVPYKRMVYDHGGNEERPKLFTVDVSFREELGKTIMYMLMIFDTAEIRQEMGKFIKQAQGNATWDRLGEYLENYQHGRDPFIINRSFEAPVEKVFELWSHTDHIKNWLPPIGFNMECDSVALKAGTTLNYKISNAQMTMYARFQYTEVTPPHTIKYKQHFINERGEISRHPAAPDFPESMDVSVKFTSEGANQTRITITCFANGTAKELEFFSGMKGSMTMGWNGSFDKFENVLAN